MGRVPFPGRLCRGPAEPRGSGERSAPAGKSGMSRFLRPPPYAPIVAAEGKVGTNVPLVRVYNPTAPTNPSLMRASWTMPRAEVIGLTPVQIQAKYSLLNAPTMIVDVDATGLPARAGTAGQNFGFGGGGVQVELLSRGATFTNPRPINGVAQ